jgi:hypothetical protein
VARTAPLPALHEVVPSCGQTAILLRVVQPEDSMGALSQKPKAAELSGRARGRYSEKDWRVTAEDRTLKTVVRGSQEVRMSAELDAIWDEILTLCQRYATHDRESMAVLVSSTKTLVTVRYNIALRRAELHEQLQQQAIETVADLAALVIKLAPADARADVQAAFERLHGRLHEEYHRIKPGERIH